MGLAVFGMTRRRKKA
ncbi:MAG: hypothetical protein ACXVAK_19240 [Vulcanimicrobiaceae bacterium]